jgi:hypothetical protein
VIPEPNVPTVSFLTSISQAAASSICLYVKRIVLDPAKLTLSGGSGLARASIYNLWVSHGFFSSPTMSTFFGDGLGYVIEHAMNYGTVSVALTSILILCLALSWGRSGGNIRHVPGPPSPSWMFGQIFDAFPRHSFTYAICSREYAATADTLYIRRIRVPLAEIIWTGLSPEGVFRG